ncbi:MAG: hypothetical protein IJZ53_10745 [Tyzzerella sp.]|nr:hypothetical protein [Tyzzerella sp.]
MLNKGSEVFENLQTRFPKSLKEKYANLKFTTSSSESDETNFPQINFQQVTAVEVGQDLSGATMNGAQFTFHITVTDNESASAVNEVMSAIVDIMKEMFFSMNQFPEIQNDSGTYKSAARFTRVIGAGDVL